MIEFFLSKFWAFICALLLLGVSSACITNISTSVEDASEKAGLREFVADIDAFLRVEGPCQIRMEMERYITDDRDSLIIRNGSVWLNG
ncbi:MAG TPA: hypothetical protein VLH13_04605, partial [Methanomassiliicoccales archaeon]|nr:hypothetical protein [Methanomassiliicoccales archaeon]